MMKMCFVLQLKQYAENGFWEWALGANLPCHILRYSMVSAFAPNAGD